MSKYEEIKNKGKVFSGDEYDYGNDENKLFIRFHVNDYPNFKDVCNLHPLEWLPPFEIYHRGNSNFFDDPFKCTNY